MTEHAKVCAGCGQTFTIEVPERFTGPLIDRLVAARSRCNQCVQADRDREDADQARQEQQGHELAQRRWLARAGLPDLLPDTLANTETEAAAAAWRWANGETPADRRTSLVLIGPVGVGKTTLAAFALRHRLQRQQGFWRSVPVLLSHLSYGFGHPAHDKALQLMDGRYMLGLDDLDKGRPTAYVGQHVFAAIDGCYSQRTPLIVTSNLSLDEIADYWPEHGAAVASRLSEGVVVHMDGDDLRIANSHRTAA